jgi:hypothetical protein
LIYICIPTHNEQQTVGVVLWKLRQVLTEYPRDYQLLVADDASTDRTQEVLEPYTRVLPLTVIRNEQRQGQAASLEMLLREASRRSEYPKRDIVVALQADFSEEPDNIVDLLKRMEAGADVAVGSRVSGRKQPAMRRLARKLSSFFVRGQQWPEGVETPFDSYRAYRLQAVKRAIEERGERRLLRYDGWACSAELLRAVLPHARRVDVVEVEDRSDRMQRPSREKPFAEAMQVRAAMRDADPVGLVSVEELDRTVVTASRARERATAAGSSRRAQGNGREARNGRDGRDGRDGRRSEGRGRGEGRERGEGRDRAPRAEGRSRGGEASKPEGKREGRQEGRREGRQDGRKERQGEARRPRNAAGDAVAGGASAAPGSAPAERQPRKRGRRGEARDQVTGGAAAGEEQESLDLLSPAEPGAESPEGGSVAGEEGMEGAEGAPRKRRRRRKRSRGGARAAGGEGEDGSPAEGGQEDGAGESGDGEGAEGEGEGGPAGEADGEGQRKRRRRGGRRGGRGRRRRPEDGAEGAGGDEGAPDSAGPQAATEGGAPSLPAGAGSAGEPGPPEE